MPGGAIGIKLCRRHTTAALRLGRYVDTALALLGMATRDAYVMQRCGYDAATGTEADADLLPVVLEELGPLCCWIGDERFEALLAAGPPQ